MFDRFWIRVKQSFAFFVFSIHICAIRLLANGCRAQKNGRRSFAVYLSKRYPSQFYISFLLRPERWGVPAIQYETRLLY